MGGFLANQGLPSRSSRLGLNLPSQPVQPNPIGGQLQATGQNLFKFLVQQEELEARKQEALHRSMANRRVAQETERLSNFRFDLPRDPNIHPFQRRDAFGRMVQQSINNISENLPPEIANDAIARLRSQASTLANSLDLEATKEFVDEERSSLDAEISIYSREALTAQTPEAKEAALSNIAIATQERVDSGVLTQEEADATLENARLGIRQQEIDFLVNTKPEVMLEHAASIMRGEGGLEGLPELVDPSKTFQDVQSELRERYAFEDRAERKAEELANKAKAANTAEFFDQAYSNKDSMDALSNLYLQVRQARKGGRISSAESIRLQATISAMQDEIATGPVEPDPDLVMDIYERMRLEPSVASDMVNEAVRRRALPVTLGRTMLNEARDRQRSDYVLNHPQVDSYIKFFRSQFGGGNNLLAGYIGEDKERALGQAIRDFEAELRGMAGRDGVMNPEILKAMPDIADRIISSYARQAAASSKEEMGSGSILPFTTSIPSLIEQGMRQVNIGTPVQIVKNRMKRELYRHFRTSVGFDEQPSTYAAWRAQVIHNISNDPNLRINVQRAEELIPTQPPPNR